MNDIQTDITRRLETALAVTAAAAEFIMPYFQAANLEVIRKSDESPVTAADRGAEQLIREQILDKFPDDSFMGEEHGDVEGTSGFRWIVDPIDGTKSFIHGVPLFGTLVGLEYNGELVVGVSRFPATDEVVYASKGQGAWWKRGDAEPQRCQVSNVSDLSEALFCVTTITGWETIGRSDTFRNISSRTRLTRGWGDCYGHIMVATGRADVMIDPQLNPWDCAALVPIMVEAGGDFIDWQGERTIHNGNGLSVNLGLKDEILELLK